MPDPRDPDAYFMVFNEIGIIAQLSAALFEQRLPPGFLVSHFAVLNGLIRVRDGRTPLELARAYQVPKTTMTHTLAGLERAGLVRMAPNPDDGRSKRVWITETGRAFRQSAIAGLGPDIATLAARLPADRIAPALPLLAELRAVLDAMRDDTERDEKRAAPSGAAPDP